MPIPMSFYEHFGGTLKLLNMGLCFLVCILEALLGCCLLLPRWPRDDEFQVSSSFYLVTECFPKTSWEQLPSLDWTRKGKKRGDEGIAKPLQEQALWAAGRRLLSSSEVIVENSTGSYREAGPPQRALEEWIECNSALKCSLWLWQSSFAVAV